MTDSRYARQMNLPEIGPAGQAKLAATSVLIVGAGGLGCPAAIYLAAAGVGRIGIVDDDSVSLDNLNRQILYSTDDLGAPKVEKASIRLSNLNPEIKIESHCRRLDQSSALELVPDYDFVIDGSDNLPTRHIISEATTVTGRPHIFGAVHRFTGQVSVFYPPEGPCYRCLHSELPPPGQVPSCEQAGVIGAVPGVIGTLQALEAMKTILNVGKPLIGRVLTFDALSGTFDEFSLERNPDCPGCGVHHQAHLIDVPSMSAVELASALQRSNPPVLLDVREPYEVEISQLANAIQIRMSDVPARIGELDPSADTVVFCRVGLRSADVVRFLRSQGFRRLHNLDGGINAYAREIDPSIPIY